MQIGMIGLGRMGGNMARRLMLGGHGVVAYATDPEAVRQIAHEGALGAMSLDGLVERARAAPRRLGDGPRRCADGAGRGRPRQRLAAGDVIVDGGNSFYKDDVRRAAALRSRGIHYVDVGTSGGIWGLERGYCLMIGGEPDVVARLDPVFRTLAPGHGTTPRTPGREAIGGTAELGYLHCGPVGAGHFVKMIHNGIEYGLMQAYAEGFDILLNARSQVLPEQHRYDLPLRDIAEVWRRGSVVSSWLLDLTAEALVESPMLAGYTGTVQDSGEGRWTVMAAIEESVPADVLSASLFVRFRSRQDHTFAERVLSAMRHKFGGHVERPSGG